MCNAHVQMDTVHMCMQMDTVHVCMQMDTVHMAHGPHNLHIARVQDVYTYEYTQHISMDTLGETTRHKIVYTHGIHKRTQKHR
jgi:hypothetical protein